MVCKKRHKETAPQEFDTKPFKSLKGLAVAAAVPVLAEKAPVQKPVEPPDNGMELFMRAVANVKPIHTQSSNATAQGASFKSAKKTAAASKSHQMEDLVDNLFIEEISRLKLSCKFTDSMPDNGEIEQLSGNRLRQVKRGIVSVDYQLDLHGLRREEALTALPVFLRSAHQKEQKAVLIITGKGNHSVEEPVLQQAVAAWLREAGRDLILEFAPAPREMGGNGAFVVFLRYDRQSSF